MTAIRFHQNPELSNREEKTAALVADYLNARAGGADRSGGHGVVALLKGGRPGPSSPFAPTWTRCP